MPIKYVGGKTKIVDELLPIVLAGNEGRPYVEPFCGSAAFLLRVPASFKRHGNDKNPFLIAMLTAVRDGWVPPSEVSEAEYQDIKRYPSKYAPELVGFVSIGCSFGSKMWGGYARGETNKGLPRNYSTEARNAVLADVTALQGVTLSAGRYTDLEIADGSVVYCDPPYQGTTDYGQYTVDNFGEFWRWAAKLVERDCQLFVSGYKSNKMTGWEIVWDKEVQTSLHSGRAANSKKNNRVEVLFQHTSQVRQLEVA